jgi:hypothetical protein
MVSVAVTSGAALVTELVLLAIVAIGLCLYLLPTIIAYRKRQRVFLVAFLNIFFGWSLVGWVAALIVAIA